MDTDQIILEKFISNHPQQSVKALHGFNNEDMAGFLETLPLDMSIKIISSMSNYKAAKCLEKTNTEIALAIMEHIDTRQIEIILRQCDEGFRNQILNAMAPKHSAILRKKLAFKADTIGVLMNSMVPYFKNDQIVQEVIIIAKREKEHMSSNILIVDENEKLQGILKLRDLLLAEDSSLISDLMKTEFPKFFADEYIESVKNHPGWYEYQSIPVIDRSEILIGSLEYRSIIERKSKKDDRNKGIAETGNALGELYRIGLTGFLQSVSK